MRWLAPALLVSALSGCVSVCDRAEALSAEFRQRHAACFTQGAPRSEPFDAEACRASMGGCSPEETAAVDEWLRCAETLPTCTVETSQGWSEQLLACTQGLGRVSPGCFKP